MIEIPLEYPNINFISGKTQSTLKSTWKILPAYMHVKLEKMVQISCDLVSGILNLLYLSPHK